MVWDFVSDSFLSTLSFVQALPFSSEPLVHFKGEPSVDELETQRAIASHLMDEEANVDFIKAFVAARDTHLDGRVDELREAIISDFKDSVLSGICPPDPPVRGPHGLAQIWLKTDVTPVMQRPFHLTGERREAHLALIEKQISLSRLEPGIGAWCTPSFPVPKKKPGEWRLVQDFRVLNEVTITDPYPLPRIDDILLRQGQFCIWSVLDMKNGYHQIPWTPSTENIRERQPPKGCSNGGFWSWG